MRHIYIFLFFTVLLTACGEKKNKFSVVGEIKDMPEQLVYLEELDIINDIVVVVDSTKTKGKFELNASASEPGLYRLRFEQGKFVLLSVDKGTLKVNGSWRSLENHTIAGSAPSSSLSTFLRVLREHMRDFQTMGDVIKTFEEQGNDSMVEVVSADIRSMNHDFTRYIEEYADTTQYLPNALFAMQMLNPAVEKEFLQTFIQNLSARFPDAKLAKDFTAKFQKKQMTGSEASPHSAGPMVGEQAPELVLNDINGNNIALSSFKGKYVLVDFWASWCGPCRQENPNVVAAYNNFKDKNFTVVGISLDNDKDKWQAAIKKDNLTWTHVSDLQGWESPAAATYAVEAIPANFLLDPEGKIIARDLRGDALQDKLQEVLK